MSTVMSDRQYGVLRCVSIGETETTNTEWKKTETIRFTINDFQYRYDECIESPPVKAHGYDWEIKVCPRVSDSKCPNVEQESDDEFVSVYLTLKEKHVIVTASCAFLCQNVKYPITAEKCGDSESGNREHLEFKTNEERGIESFLQRENMGSFLEDDGSFVIECDIRVLGVRRSVWYPRGIEQQSIVMDMYQGAASETADVVFSVRGETFRAHRSVLLVRWKKMYEIAEEFGGFDDETPVDQPIPIESVSAPVFKTLLEYAYTVRITPEIASRQSAVEHLAGADLYECVPMKLYFESVIVEKFLTAKNAAWMLMFADATSCALLKEAAIGVFLAEPETVKKNLAWSQVEESNRLLKELVGAYVSSRGNSGNNHDAAAAADDDEADRLDVTALREELQRAGLEVDGSRGVLVNRWKTLRSSPVVETATDDDDEGTDPCGT